MSKEIKLNIPKNTNSDDVYSEYGEISFDTGIDGVEIKGGVVVENKISF